MTKAFLFLARVTPASPSSDGPNEWVLVCESPTLVQIRPVSTSCEAGIPESSSLPAPGMKNTATPSLATPNSLLQARAWPLLGPRVTRPSRGRSLKGKSSLGMSSFLRGNKTS